MPRPSALTREEDTGPPGLPAPVGRGYNFGMMYLLFYDYGENALERRAPYREQHLGLLRQNLDASDLVMAGAYTDPLDGAAIVFRTREAAEAFVAADPYVSSGLVTDWRIREWNVVVGG